MEITTKQFLESEIESLDKRYRANLINSLSGFKSANLLGTKDATGQENLAIISSAVHIGADPATMGVIFRPNTVPRHTYENILETKEFTVNHIAKEFYLAVLIDRSTSRIAFVAS